MRDACHRRHHTTDQHTLVTAVLDVMLIFNNAFSLIIRLIAKHIKEALEFSVYPSVLLITTLLRVALNVSSRG
jgi:flagellar biosynthesis component FlhA